MLPHALLLLLVLPVLGLAAQEQQVLSPPPPAKQPHGRFLHLTDIHPDTHYVPYTRPSSACHSTHFGKKSKRVAGFWGTPVSDCDSPLRLVDSALAFAEQWAGQVDWVVWTGDSARHDNDPQMARTQDEIEQSNQYLTDRMKKAFWDRGVPVIPSIGNNDVWPHNVMYPGPSSTTRTYAEMWSPLLSPETNLSTLAHGVYFSTPLLAEHKLAAISLNTLFFYDSNKAVDGCVEQEDAGSEEMVWLERELERFRKDGWRVYITGHVPPSSRNYYAGCYRKYGELALRFQDIILGHLYGHMNMDHYFWISLDEVIAASKPKSSKFKLHTRGAHDFDHEDLLKDFSDLPKPAKVDYADYAVVNVPASVVPTYFPGIRVYTYNDSGIFPPPPIEPPSALKDKDDPNPCKGKKKNSKQCVGGKPRHTSPYAAAMLNGPFTPTGYAQYFMPDLEDATEDVPPAWELEYVTYSREAWNRSLLEGRELLPREFVPPELGGWMVHPSLLAASDEEGDTGEPEEVDKKKKKKKKGKKKERERNLVPYEMPDLTIPSWLGLARRLTREKGVWREFKRNMYVGTGEEE
ncbi:hypothetical protein CALVIDRAFT_536427 [Calocera viscosa TUFC12733]|uniref:Calcineurin-like phosphoesterase domain-containing protein n=1 Tax=Calocera viscosa (strain TUFC12733) TaxID=1330018 RepID=A0A167N766_CALVF|nr:hypothetical protein CALVIDRAFT_536427 [Calocera viscosa TUFC12733]